MTPDAIPLALVAALALAAPAYAQGGHEHHHPAPAPTATPAPAGDHAAHGIDHALMADPLMDRARAMGSGTSWNPALSPMRMWAWRPGDWLVMAHGDLVGGLNRQGGLRGGSPVWAAENWQMVMGSRYWGPGILDLRAMTSLEPWTLPPGGTPQLLQTGETWQNQPLIDKQHPHDLIMELAGRYTWSLADATSLFLYGGLAGEPALGPSAFMHRPSAADNHWAPLSHHLQDSTHIAYGVVTTGARVGPFQLEGSLFNGREPDENRVGFDLGPLDSWSSRLSWFPGPSWALQASTGRLTSPELAAPGDIHRTTASLMHVHEARWGWWSTSFVWGQNLELHGEPRMLQSYGLESQLDHGPNHLYGRFELVDKTGLPLAGADHHDTNRVGALTLGVARDVDWSDALDLAVGADATAYSLDADTRDAYGFNPLSFRAYLRMRPPTMQHGGGHE